ncbi:hypothetical protein JXJ21_05510 [candidate division KSB1 bacterium]|nr:hypothetical protein [candidate division KSB1 bacterium]
MPHQSRSHLFVILLYQHKNGEMIMASEQTLHQQLQIEWQDHIQTRMQTWKTLEIEAALVLGLIGADLKFDNIFVVIIIGIILILSSISGIAITAHHRKAQIRKFTHIDRIEEKLELHADDLLSNVHVPSEFRWFDVINFKKVNTPLFILRMHFAILSFTAIYILARLALNIPI